MRKVVRRLPWAPLLGLVAILGACEVNTSPKTLSGGSSVTPGSTPIDTSDSFGLRFAYRDDTISSNYYVMLQGVTATSTESKISTNCAADASNCACYFYKSTSDTSPLTSSEIIYSSSSNLITCKIPSGTATDYNYVILKQLSGSKSSGMMNIQTTLTLSEILGTDHMKTKVRRIFTYTCARTFLEGTNVSASSVDCTANTAINYLKANYNYYTYDNIYDPTDTIRSDFTKRTTEIDLTNVCEIPTIKTVLCSSTSDTARFGLYSEKTSLFTTAISLSSGPDKGSSIMGYAAPSDGSGNCPAGLTKIGVYVARPTSQTATPSWFINVNGNLNDNLMSPVPYPSVSGSPADFTVTRISGTTNCGLQADNKYHCFEPNGAQSTLTTATYGVSPPYVCGIPLSAIQ